ncbi:hypothetical protein [Tenacibaculum agarivorans]|uniref:hypothetical protein n=1 Tax=Tenacibaculum agarivorans TaxID=1908389 RepID=UPI00094B7F8B|nr:hypothetical protein [Tenacibaculum agarivorans]
MALLILTKEKVKPENIIESIIRLSSDNGFTININKKDELSLSKYQDIYLSKDYKKDNQECEDYFYLGLETNQMELEENGQKYYRLGVTDQAEYDHLMYDFSLAYLKFNPNHVISLYGESFFTLEDLEKIEAEGGYYKDWCYGVYRDDKD